MQKPNTNMPDDSQLYLHMAVVYTSIVSASWILDFSGSDKSPCIFFDNSQPAVFLLKENRKQRKVPRFCNGSEAASRPCHFLF